MLFELLHLQRRSYCILWRKNPIKRREDIFPHHHTLNCAKITILIRENNSENNKLGVMLCLGTVWSHI